MQLSPGTTRLKLMQVAMSLLKTSLFAVLLATFWLLVINKTNGLLIYKLYGSKLV